MQELVTDPLKILKVGAAHPGAVQPRCGEGRSTRTTGLARFSSGGFADAARSHPDHATWSGRTPINLDLFTANSQGNRHSGRDNGIGHTGGAWSGDVNAPGAPWLGGTKRVGTGR
jgi:hypothetical protein